MEDQGIPVGEIFRDFTPDDFEFFEPSACWEPPCWISSPLGFRAVSERARRKFIFPLSLRFQADPWARKAVYEQISSQFLTIYEHAHLVGDIWTPFLWKQLDALQNAVSITSHLFQPPMQFVPRRAFERATLDEILRGDPEEFDIYLADDFDSSRCEVTVLRIHSSLWHFTAGQKYLWFEKRVPWRLQREDVLPWFDATVQKLPRNRQPMDWSAWTGKFLRSHPEFTPVSNANLPWREQPPIILVFGTRNEVGYAASFRLERARIKGIKRVGDETFIRATIANRYPPPRDWLWDFRIVSPTARHAERLESRLLSGEQIHFGIGDDISGLVAAKDDMIHCINVAPHLIAKHYSREGMILLSSTPQRLRHKMYEYHKESQCIEGMGQLQEPEQ